MADVHIYTDGSACSNSGAAAWAALVQAGRREWLIGDLMKTHDSTEAEKRAIFMAALVVPNDKFAIIYTDHQSLAARLSRSRELRHNINCICVPRGTLGTTRANLLAGDLMRQGRGGRRVARQNLFVGRI